MTDSVEVSQSRTDLADSCCPVCQEPLGVGGEVVQCPACGCWHHLDCWEYNGNRCSAHGCSGRGSPPSQQVLPSSSQEGPPEAARVAPDDISISAPPVSDPAILSQITILEDIHVTDDLVVGVSALLSTDMPGADGENAAATDEIRIEPWELTLQGLSTKRGVTKLLAKTGVQRILGRYVKGKDYYVGLGVVLVWIVVLLILGIIGLAVVYSVVLN